MWLKGEVVAVIGPNGAGKSTLLPDNCRRCGVPSRASVMFDGGFNSAAWLPETLAARGHCPGAGRAAYIRLTNRGGKPSGLAPPRGATGTRCRPILSGYSIMFPVLLRALPPARQGNFPAVSSQCSPSPGPCWHGHACCGPTNPRLALHRSSCWQVYDVYIRIEAARA